MKKTPEMRDCISGVESFVETCHGASLMARLYINYNLVDRYLVGFAVDKYYHYSVFVDLDFVFG